MGFLAQLAMAAVVTGIVSVVLIGVQATLAGLGTQLLGLFTSSGTIIGDFANDIQLFITTQQPSFTTIPAIVNIAYSLVVLFFLIDLFGQVISFDKVTVESIIRMLVKLLVARILIGAAPQICEGIYVTLNNTLAGQVGGFAGSIVLPPLDANLLLGSNFSAGAAGIKGTVEVVLKALIAVYWGINLMDAIVNTFGMGLIWVALLTGITETVFSLVLLLVYALIVKLVCGIVIIMQKITLYIRLIEVTILTALSPIAMAGIVSPEFKGMTKKFLFSFGALSLQGAIIVIACQIAIAIGGASPALPTAINFDEALSIGKNLILPIVQVVLAGMLISKSRSFANAILSG